MATEQGIVVRTAVDTAWVRTTPGSACAGCSAKGSCTAAGEEKEVRVVNAVGAAVGDRIVITFETGPFLKATFLLYVFPILALLAGALAGQWAGPVVQIGESAASALVGFGSFALALGFVRARGNRLALSRRYQPKISRVLKKCE